MSDVTSKYVLDFDQKGVPKAEQEVKKFGDTMDKALTRAQKNVTELDKRMEILRKTILKTAGDFAKAMEKGFDTRKIVRNLDALNKQMARSNRLANGGGGGSGGGGGGVPFDSRMDGQFGPAIPMGGGGGARAGGGGGGGGGGGSGGGMGGGSGGGRGFMQGFLQGTLPPGFFVERQNSLRQYAGIQAGRVASGAASSFLTGGGLGGYVGGGVAGAILDRAGSYAQGAIGAQRSQLGALPYLGMGNLHQMGTKLDAGTVAGTRLGAAAEDVTSYRAAVAARSGLSQTETAGQGLDTLGLAAQTRYGMAPGQVGAFVQAGAMGGTQSKASGADQMVSAINEGMSLALKGSDLQSFLGSIADDITGWKQTGIQVNPESLGAVARELSTTGNMGNVRGAYSAAGAISTYRQIGQQGAQSPEQIELLQRLGATSADPMSMLHQERLLADPKNAGKAAKAAREELMDLVRRSGDDDVAFKAITRAAPGLGVNMGPQEVNDLIDQAHGRKSARRATSAIRAAQNKQGTTAGGIIGEAQGAVSPVLQTDAEQTNKRQAIGENTAKTIQELATAADLAAQGAGKLVKGMEGATTAAVKFASKVSDAVTKLFGGDTDTPAQPSSEVTP